MKPKNPSGLSPRQIKQVIAMEKDIRDAEPKPPPATNYQMRQRNERLEYLKDLAKKRKPTNIRELAALVEETYPGISTPTRNTYARAVNRILRLPYTSDFPEV